MPRLRFSLLFMLLLIVSACVIFAYISYKRDRGRDRLVRDLQRIGENLADAEVTEQKVSSGGTTDQATSANSQSVEIEFVSDLPKEAQKELAEFNQPPTRLDQLMANTEPAVTQIKFSDVKISASDAKSIAATHAAGAIQNLRFENVEIDDAAVAFFEDWMAVKTMVFIQTKVPVAWARVLSKKRLESLTFAGDFGDFKLETLGRFSNADSEEATGMTSSEKTIEKLILCIPGMTGAQRAKLTSQLEGTEIQLIAPALQLIPLPDDSKPLLPLSQHDPDESAKMKRVLDHLHSTLDSLDPPARNEFSPPATSEQIARLEAVLQIPLHPTMRAFLEIHEGQPARDDELVEMERLLTIEDMIQYHREWKSYALEKERFEYDYDPTFNNFINPNLLAIGTSEDHLIGMNMVTGTLHQWYSEERELVDLPSVTLEGYFKTIIAQLEAGKFKRWKPHAYGDWEDKVYVEMPGR